MSSLLPTPPHSPHPACSVIRNRMKTIKVESRVPQHKKFFPESRIRHFFTLDVIGSLLECPCFRCFTYRRDQQIDNPSSYVQKIAGRFHDDRFHNSYMLLLALLTYIECPALIYSFIRANCNDRYFTKHLETFTDTYVKDNIWFEIPASNISDYPQEFQEEKYKFVIQHLQGDHYEEYSSSVILPFVNESRIGRSTDNGEIINEGHFGEVYSFEVIEEYCHFSELPNVRRFARKELRRHTPHAHFCEERDNLLLVKKLEDKHLIKIVKSYKHGDVYNFIFPLAKTNLNLFLRQPRYGAFSDFRGPISQHPLWKQMLGVARGLHKVLVYEAPDSKLGNSLYGYHFDLKPANILVDWLGNLLITDFGQARFKKVDGTSSRVTGLGGNETYAPPEIDMDMVVNNRKYDIWSLGCIFLEIIIFVVRGAAGLYEFESLRSQVDPTTQHQDNRFFKRVPRLGSDQLQHLTHVSYVYELKSCVHQCLEHLSESVIDESSRSFIDKLLEVVKLMLNTDVQLRLSSKDVCLRLSTILSDQTLYNEEVQTRPLQIPQRPTEGLDIGTDLMTNVRPISYNFEGFWNAAPMHFVQDTTLLYVQLLENMRWVKRRVGRWSEVKLIPHYAMLYDGRQSLTDATLILHPGEMHNVYAQRYAKLSTPDVSIVQEVLLSQKLHMHIGLETATVKLKQRRPISKFIPRWKGVREPLTIPDCADTDAASVQLWMDAPRHDTIGPSRAERRDSPRSLRLGPAIARVIIFYKRSILILRLARNERVQPRLGPDVSPTCITLVPTRPNTDSSFPVSLLKSTTEGALPGFLLSRDDFEAEESRNRVECAELKLRFRTAEDADCFHRGYKRLKKQWHEQQKQFENLQGHVGSAVGYSRAV